jgi:hypothetical protein
VINSDAQQALIDLAVSRHEIADPASGQETDAQRARVGREVWELERGFAVWVLILGFAVKVGRAAMRQRGGKAEKERECVCVCVCMRCRGAWRMGWELAERCKSCHVQSGCC